MADYADMYRTLFRAQTQAIEVLTQAVEILKKAQQETEELYINSSEDNITLLRPERADGCGSASDECSNCFISLPESV